MSIAEELSKLNELKEKGAITQGEFDKQKADLLGGPTKRGRASGLWWKLLVGAVGAVGLIASLAINFNKGVASLPACDSEQAKSTLGEAFNRSQFARTMNLSAVEVTDAAEKAFDAKANARTCAGNVAMNNRSTARVIYTMQGRAGGQYLLTFEVTDEPARAPTVSTATAPSQAPDPAQPTATLPAESERLANTRFGTVRVAAGQLDLAGKVIPLDGDLGISQKFEMADRDVLLIESLHGSGCPATYYFVSVSAAGASATPSFGTCSDEAKVSREGEQVIVSLAGFAGPSEPQAVREQAAARSHRFVFQAGTVKEVEAPATPTAR